jgi:hypothetical protein
LERKWIRARNGAIENRSLVTASAATTAAASTAVATISATATAALDLGTGFVHVQGAAPELGTIQGGNGFISLFGVGHLHEAEAAGAAGITVGHNADPVDLSVGFEDAPQFFFRSVEVEVPNENVLHASGL